MTALCEHDMLLNWSWQLLVTVLGDGPARHVSLHDLHSVLSCCRMLACSVVSMCCQGMLLTFAD